jgi:tRNA threonylcarbamoyl adenosine modification protein YeaZ
LIFVIDTTSARSALALLRPDGTVVAEQIDGSGPGFDLPARFRAMAGKQTLTKVAVAVGPGSFTGLRAGVSFGLGLAIGLKVPIIPLPSLQLQAARSLAPVVAATEAGRGRVYFLAPGSEAALAEPVDLPREWPVAGWLRPATEAALAAAGLSFKPDSELRSFGAAAALRLETAFEVAYGSLRLEYMQAFSTRA